MHFDNFGILCAPIPGVLIYLGIVVELIQEGFDIALVLDGHKARLEVLSEGQILVAVSLAWYLSASSAA